MSTVLTVGEIFHTAPFHIFCAFSCIFREEKGVFISNVSRKGREYLRRFCE